MHIVIDARIINTSTGTYVRQLLNYLQDIDQENKYSVLVPTKDKNFWQPHNPNFTVHTVDFKNYSFEEQIGFKKYLDKLGADLVHFIMPQQPIFYKGKHVTTFHDLILLNTYNSDKNWLIFHAKQLVGRFVFKNVARKSDHIITPSQYTRDKLVALSRIPANKVTVTYESADVFIDKLQPYDHPFSKFILYVGAQSDYKNIKRLGDAHQELLTAYPDLGLILVGRKNDSAKINEAYFKSKNYKNILFTDFIPDEQRDWLFTQAAAYIFPSLMEGFGLPALEAMGYGAPVVSSNATCLPEVYEQAAHYFNPTDVEDIARSIEEVISNEDLRQDLIKKGHEQVKKYSWRRMAEETLDVYERILRS